MNDTILSAIISGVIGFVGALLGAFVGGKFNIKASMEATQRSINAQNEVINKAKIFEDNKRTEEIKNSIRMIYLDFTSAIWESWFSVKIRPADINVPMIPMNAQYPKSISLVSEEFNTHELILINKMYGMIEKIRSDIFRYKNRDEILSSTYTFLKIIYDEKYIVMDSHKSNITQDFALANLSTYYQLLLNKLKEKSGLV